MTVATSRHRESRRNRKKHRAGKPYSSLDLMLVCAFLRQMAHRDRGCSAHPAFPCASIWEAKLTQSSGSHAARNADAYPHRCLKMESKTRTMPLRPPLRGRVVSHSAEALCGGMGTVSPAGVPVWRDHQPRLKFRCAPCESTSPPGEDELHRQGDRVFTWLAQVDHEAMPSSRVSLFQNPSYDDRSAGRRAEIVAVARHQIALQHLVPFRDRPGKR